MAPLDPCAPPDLRHLRRLTDDTGILQHTARAAPAPEFGYALDDVARALIVVTETARLFGNQEVLIINQGEGDRRALGELADIYLQFIEYCQQPDGRFHNFVAPDRSFQDDTGSLDAYGRTLWALGICLRNATQSDRVARMFQNALPHLGDNPSLRSKAFALLGVLAALERDTQLDVQSQALRLVSDLVHEYDDAAADDWPWFEDILAYSNGALPYALLVAAGNARLYAHNAQLVDRARAVGLKSLDFLLRVGSVDGVPAPVGNAGWYRRGGERALYDQQCVDAAAMVVAAVQASVVTGEPRYREAAETWWGWFFGNNTNQRPLYRPEDGAVYDGLTPEGVNENRGAESVLVFLLAHLALTEAFCGKRPTGSHQDSEVLPRY